MGPCACVWQRVCSWQREASPASPASASCLLPPVAPGYPSRFCLCRRFIIPFLLLFPHSAAAFVYCFGISSSSPAQLPFFFSSWACQISQHISNSRRIRWSNSLCMPTLTLLWNAPHMRHASRPTPMANRLCVLAAWGLVWQLLLLLSLLVLNYDSPTNHFVMLVVILATVTKLFDDR